MKENEMRAKMGKDGAIEYLKEPQYHGDPVRPEQGILVFTIFGENMRGMFEKAGLTFEKLGYTSVLRGIISPKPLIFIAKKQRHAT